MKKGIFINTRPARCAGYELIIGDVTIDHKPYEDWWVDPNLVDKFIALDIQRHSAFSQNPFDLLLV